MKIEFQFQPPAPLDYAQFLTAECPEESVTFSGITKLKKNIEDDSKKFKVRISRAPLSKSDVKSSDQDQQSQADWNQFIEHTQFTEEPEIKHLEVPEPPPEEPQPVEEDWQFVTTNFDAEVAPTLG